MRGRRKKIDSFFARDAPEWYKDAIIYEVHVRAFYDSDGNGIGDFIGLTKKLDYIKDLGITAIWLLPFYPSPLKDDGYDISDYFNVHPDYGTLTDFKLFLQEAHAKDIRIIIELCLNHTSDQHAWFQKARLSKPGSKWRDYYVWSDSVDRYKEARIIFQDFESSNWSWDPIAKAYYWHRFYSHQPDLNYRNPHVQQAIHEIVDFWFDMGVAGMRLDAVPYLFEREGTDCENLPETHEFLKKIRSHVDNRYTNRMLLAEANQWPEDAAAYFGEGDEAHMAYHFPLMPRLFLALRMEDSYPIIDILQQTPVIPDTCQWGLFLRNHDELTLEMVTDEERDYMYRVYATDPHQRINLGIRRRLAPLMRNDRREMELMNILLFSLPGTPILYYGDEIGMGDNCYLGDRNGVRTPMQWNSDINAGFSRSNPQQLYLPVIIDPEYHYLAVNIQNQQRNSSSFLWWIKRLIGTTKRHPAFSRGSIHFLSTKNPKLIAFIREYQEEKVLVIVNLAKTSQYVQLDLSSYAGNIPVEIFSWNKFPPVRKEPYTLTIGTHDYFWFRLEENVAAGRDDMEQIPNLPLSPPIQSFLMVEEKKQVEEIFGSYLQRWAPHSRSLSPPGQVKILEHFPLGKEYLKPSDLVLLEETFSDGTSRYFFLPIIFLSGEESRIIIQEVPRYVIARFLLDSEDGIICESYFDRIFRERFLMLLAKRKLIRGSHGTIRIDLDKGCKKEILRQITTATPYLHAGRGLCQFLITTNGYSVKIYRSLEEGINPTEEIVRFLNQKTTFTNCPVHIGSIQYRMPHREPMIIGIVQETPENKGNGISFAEDSVNNFINGILSRQEEISALGIDPVKLIQTGEDLPTQIQDIIGSFCMYMLDILGRRTGEFHLALQSDEQDPVFAPEPFSDLYQRSLFQSFQTQVRLMVRNLETGILEYPEQTQEIIRELILKESEIIQDIRPITGRRIHTVKSRIHGDYHLGNVLFTGKDFIIVNFEGDPTRTLNERRLKYSPFRDVAGMIWSFTYSAQAIFNKVELIRPEDTAFLKPWVRFWVSCVMHNFLKSYFEIIESSGLIPSNPGDLEMLLRIYTLERAIAKVVYLQSVRPDRLHIGIMVLLEILGRPFEVQNLDRCV